MRLLIKKWFCNASDAEVKVTFTISFLACIRLLLFALTKEKVYPLVSSIVLLCLLFLITFFRVKYSIVEKNWNKDFKPITDSQSVGNFSNVKQKGNIILLDSAYGKREINQNFIRLLSQQTGIGINQLVLVRQEQKDGKEKLYIIDLDSKQLPFPEKPVSKSFVAALSPAFAKQGIQELLNAGDGAARD